MALTISYFMIWTLRFLSFGFEFPKLVVLEILKVDEDT